MGIEEIIKYVIEKFKQALVAVENFGSGALSWFDNIFPPETRSSKIQHWFHIAQPYIIFAVVFTIVICFLRCCCKCCCGGRGGGRGVRMMKAPGRNVRMPRNVFEANPRGYFQNLRASPGDQLC